MLKRQLKVLGLEADTASSGVEGLLKWRRDGHTLVITDLQMPEMDGYAFTRAIRAEQDQRKAAQADGGRLHRQYAQRGARPVHGCGDGRLSHQARRARHPARKAHAVAGQRCIAQDRAPRHAPVAAPATTAIDRARIQQLAGGPEGIAEVLAQLESGVRADIAALQVALESANCAALRSAAHRIKGSALTIGAEPWRRSLHAWWTRPRTSTRAQLMSNARTLLDDLERVLVSARVQRNAPSS